MRGEVRMGGVRRSMRGYMKAWKEREGKSISETAQPYRVVTTSYARAGSVAPRAAGV